jgi:hypothetical protein
MLGVTGSDESDEMQRTSMKSGKDETDYGIAVKGTAKVFNDLSNPAETLTRLMLYSTTLCERDKKAVGYERRGSHRLVSCNMVYSTPNIAVRMNTSIRTGMTHSLRLLSYYTFKMKPR